MEVYCTLRIVVLHKSSALDIVDFFIKYSRRDYKFETFSIYF